MNGESEEDSDGNPVEITKEVTNPQATSEVNDDPSIYPCDNMHQNYPSVVGTFKDPDTQLEKVIIAVSLPGGVKNVKTELNDDGTRLLVKYAWPQPIFDMEDLFRKQLADQLINLHHPKVLCVQNGLEKVRKRIDAAPESLLTLNLPIKVQTSSDSWTKSGIKRDDGTQLVLVELTGYVKQYNKKITDETVTFDA